MHSSHSFELIAFLVNLKNGIWLMGVSSWIFGILDRSFASFADGYVSALDIVQIFIAAFFFVSWLFLKPSSFKLIPRTRAE
jgi:uncharacterized membrane protein